MQTADLHHLRAGRATEAVQARLTAHDRALVERAAAQAGISISTMLRVAALAAAQAVLDGNTTSNHPPTTETGDAPVGGIAGAS